MADKFFDLPPIRDDAAQPGTVDYAILQWCEDRLQRGQQFVEASVGYDNINRALDGVFANEKETAASYVPTPKPLSRTKANLVAKTAEDLTALLTDTRVFWNYATHNPKYEEQARISNKQAEDWYTSRLIDLRIADAIRYYTVAGSGFVHLYYSRRLNDMMVEAEDPRSVFPIEPISYHTVQDALGIIIRKARTPNWVKAEYDKDVKADIGDPGIFGWFTRVIGGMAKNKHSGPLSKRAGDDDAIPATPTVFVNTMYLDDKRVNKTKDHVLMGEWEKDDKGKDQPKTQWSYRVAPGAPLYPFKRLIVWGGGALLYDGPSPYWHGKYPIIKLTLNPWPKSWLGKGPLWDVLPLNTSLNSLLRVVDDHAAMVAQPGVVADRNVSKSEMDKFNSRAPGYKIRTNLASGKGIQVVIPPPLDQSLWQHISWIQDMIKQLSGTADVSQMAQLAQIPSDDTIDTIMKAMTPGVRLRSRILEGFMKEFAEMYLYCIAEFDTLPKRVAKFGPDGVTAEDYDYDPGTFIPDDVPDGSPGDIASTEDALGLDNPRPRYERAKAMLTAFTFNFKPGSLLNSAATQDRLEDLLLSKMGYLDAFTLMENLGKMNFAPPSIKVPNSILERLQLQQALGIGMIANAQGRKATDQAPPSLQSQPGGDATLATS
jgi:hypothetical protein